MPPKRKPTPVPNGNMLVIQLPNALGFSIDKTTKNTLVEFKLPSKF